MKLAGADLGQAQVKLDGKVVVVVEVVVKERVRVKFNYYSGWVGGGWSDKRELILIST